VGTPCRNAGRSKFVGKTPQASSVPTIFDETAFAAPSMPFVNATPFLALDAPYLDEHGREVVLAIVKGTFELDAAGRLELAEEQAEVRVADVPYDPESPKSSLRYVSDVCTRKQGTDVVVVGEAVSSRPTTVLDVAVRVREQVATLRIHGERLFYRAAVGIGIGPSAKFERAPVVYEKAYGGASADWTVVETRNPSGVGVAKRAADLIDTPAPRIEHPARPHTSASDKHAPMGFNAIPGHWSPRRELTGTVDDAWVRTRIPIMPKDFDIRFNNVAHPSLQLDPVAPGDDVSVAGMTAEGALSFAMPRFPVVFYGLFDVGPKTVVRPHVDTLLIEPSRRRLEVVCRAHFPMGRGIRVLREIRADVDE
jgi:hypothetical protein